MSCFFIPCENFTGKDALKEASTRFSSFGKKALLVTDKVLAGMPIMQTVQSAITSVGIECVVFDGTVPNPTVKNVEDGLAMLQQNGCDFVISFGGGSPHDCAKGIAIVAANGGNIKDYEGIDQSAKPQLPLIAINTTAGTASEMTRFSIITDTDRKVKMAIVDKHITPVLSVNDPELMLSVPAALTAATGMDALTHAVEAYVSTIANPITDACALHAFELIAKYLKRAVDNGSDFEARDQMAHAQFLAGMAFNNASLGYVHAMAHQLGGFYDLPHGVCNAILLPHVEAFNAPACAGRLKTVAEKMGVNVSGMSDEQGAQAALEAIKSLSASIGIPGSLSELGAKAEDIPTLATNALKDVCSLTNPIQGSQADVEGIYKNAM